MPQAILQESRQDRSRGSCCEREQQGQSKCRYDQQELKWGEEDQSQLRSSFARYSNATLTVGVALSEITKGVAARPKNGDRVGGVVHLDEGMGGLRWSSSCFGRWQGGEKTDAFSLLLLLPCEDTGAAYCGRMGRLMMGSDEALPCSGKWCVGDGDGVDGRREGAARTAAPFWAERALSSRSSRVERPRGRAGRAGRSTSSDCFVAFLRSKPRSSAKLVLASEQRIPCCLARRAALYKS